MDNAELMNQEVVSIGSIMILTFLWTVNRVFVSSNNTKLSRNPKLSEIGMVMIMTPFIKLLVVIFKWYDILLSWQLSNISPKLKQNFLHAAV